MMEVLREAPKLDFRFASIEDTENIVFLVNRAFTVEKGSTGLAFTSQDRVRVEEVEACLHGGICDRRWLVLETPRPDETMVAAALICAATSPGTGTLEVLAVDPLRQGRGLGSLLLRRAEDVLLNFRCRFVKMRVAQWREDILAWAGRQGYREIGGGVWGELDGESGEALTRPTRYIMLTRDLLADETSTRTLGDRTPRLTPFTDAELENQKEREHVALNRASSATACASPLKVVEGKRGINGECTGDIDSTEDAPGLAVFLSNVLRGGGLRVEEEEEKTEPAQDSVSLDAALTLVPSAPTMPDVEAAAATVEPTGTHPLSTPLPQVSVTATHFAGDSCPRAGRSSDTFDPAANDCRGDQKVEPQDAAKRNAECGPPRAVTEVTVDGEGAGSFSREQGQVEVGDEGEESVESLLRSLVRALNTEQGRADLARLAEAGEGCSDANESR